MLYDFPILSVTLLQVNFCKNGSQIHSFIFCFKFLKQLGTVFFANVTGGISAFVGDYFRVDYYTFGALVSIYSSRMVYVRLTQNKLQCVFMVTKEHVTWCNSELQCFYSGTQ